MTPRGCTTPRGFTRGPAAHAAEGLHDAEARDADQLTRAATPSALHTSAEGERTSCTRRARDQLHTSRRGCEGATRTAVDTLTRYRDQPPRDQLTRYRDQLTTPSATPRGSLTSAMTRTAAQALAHQPPRVCRGSADQLHTSEPRRTGSDAQGRRGCAEGERRGPAHHAPRGSLTSCMTPRADQPPRDQLTSGPLWTRRGAAHAERDADQLTSCTRRGGPAAQALAHHAERGPLWTRAEGARTSA
jgi:hypothetical protein